MGNLIMFTSCKGGVGKTTLVSCIAAALSKKGKRVIAVDMNFGVRCLDLTLGFENSICSDAYDFINGGCTLDQAYTFSPDMPNLFFMPAPAGFDNAKQKSITQKKTDNFLSALKNEFDFVLVDMATGFGELFGLVASSPLVDTAVVVCSHTLASVRCAEKTAFELYKLGKTDPRLIINMFDIPSVLKGIHPGIIEIIERSCVKLLGIVPQDDIIDGILQQGGLINCLTPQCNGFVAINNIAGRLNGEDVSLLKDIVKLSKREKLL